MELYKKLLKVKKKIGKISKDSTNPFFKSKYFDVNALLEHVEPLLQEERLLLIQPIENGFVCSMILDTETGESIKSQLVLQDFADPQKTGSAITYYRRYTLQSLLGLQAEDDDANIASANTYNQKPSDTFQKVTTWLSADQFNKALEADEKGIKATLSMYSGKNGKGMKKEYREQLEKLLKAFPA